MIYKTWHERERLQWHSRMATKKERERERERERKRERERERERKCERAKGADVEERSQTGTTYVREGIERVAKREGKGDCRMAVSLR